MSTRIGRGRAVVAMVLALGLGTAACGSGGNYADTPLPTPTTTTTPPGSAGAVPVACTNATQSYNPLPSLTLPASMAGIRNRGYLIAGVSADSLLLGSRNPVNGQIEGFDIDMVKEVAKAVFGDPNKVQLVVIQSSERIPALRDGRVDIVARNMTMTCDRWTQIAFSAEYYHSGLKILVPKGSTVTSLEALSGKKVCAPNGTSTMDKVKATQGVVPVGSGTHTGCLVLFQQGDVDAIAGDDTVLAGLVAQDPYAFVPPIQPLTAEPYGLGIKLDNREFVSYVNTLLDQMKGDGRWKAIYDRWFAGPLGPAPAPPPSVYGRP
jgi:polar amino acid transport system substrate-binding protein